MDLGMRERPREVELSSSTFSLLKVSFPSPEFHTCLAAPNMGNTHATNEKHKANTTDR